MLQVYTSPSCASCRKVKKYFNLYNIKYVEKNIFSTPLSKDDIIKMLMRSENGFEDIISTRSKIFKDNDLEIENMKMNDLIDFIIENPSVLKRPIIVADEEIQVGYNDDDITLFLPPEIRERECEMCFSNPLDECEFIQEISKQINKKG